MIVRLIKAVDHDTLTPHALTNPNVANVPNEAYIGRQFRYKINADDSHVYLHRQQQSKLSVHHPGNHPPMRTRRLGSTRLA